MERMLRAFAIPGPMFGPEPVIETREDAARVRLAYIEAMGLDPFSLGDADVELLVTAERLWLVGALDRDETNTMLAPLRVRVDPSSTG